MDRKRKAVLEKISRNIYLRAIRDGFIAKQFQLSCSQVYLF